MKITISKDNGEVLATIDVVNTVRPENHPDDDYETVFLERDDILDAVGDELDVILKKKLT